MFLPPPSSYRRTLYSPPEDTSPLLPPPLSPVVVSLHLVEEHFALPRGRCWDEVFVQQAQDVRADVFEFVLDLGVEQGRLGAVE